MAVIATKEIRDRIYTILDGLTAVSGTTFTPAPRIPRNVQDYEGYTAITRMQSATLAPVSADQRTETQRWVIQIYSPQLGLGLDAMREDHMYDYRDLVLTAFCNKRNLQVSGVGLNNVTGSRVISDRFQAPAELAGVFRYLWEFVLEVNILKDKTC